MKFQEEGEGGGKDLIKLKDKEHVYGVLRGEMYEFRQHWPEPKKSVVCSGEGCPLCARQMKASFRFRVNMIVSEGGGWTPKILEQGWKVYEQLRNINKENPIENVLLKLSRTGSGQNDTQYFAMPVKPLTPDVATSIEAITLHDVRAFGQDQGENQPRSIQPTMNESDIPF